MTDTTTAPAPTRRVVRGAVRTVGWLFIATGATLLLFLVWLLWITGLGTSDVQQELLEGFEGFGEAGVDGDVLRDGGLEDDLGIDGDPFDIDLGSGFAVLEFERPGEEVSPVNDKPLVVVRGADSMNLRRGPGVVVPSVAPGERGNIAIAGHRTTYGAPFYNMDLLQAGDLVHLTDRAGRRFTYRVLEGSGEVSDGTRVIGPSELWVLGRQPLGRDGSFLTLMTCHPRFSSARRLVAFAELVQ